MYGEMLASAAGGQVEKVYLHFTLSHAESS
jgi:hypothetical protein